MNNLRLVFLAILLTMCSSTNWAVLIAGSNTWYNYRHQADVFHAYQVLLKKGFSADNIITLAYDDIANNKLNPFPGKVFNKPTYADPGVDVYAGVKIDYSGPDVTPQVFLAILQGNKSFVSGKGNGKVLESTENDNVFMFFSDHGSPGLIAFPSKYLYADQLLTTFTHIKGKFNKFVFYLQSCQSGSMFVNLPKTTKIYALSAANPTESSWGCYCSPQDVIQGKHIGTCLGDLFSVKFIEGTEEQDLTKLSLDEQFKQIRTATTESHVMQWGDLSFTTDTVSEFIGPSTKSGQPAKIFNLLRNKLNYQQYLQGSSSFDSRYNKINILTANFKRQKTIEAAELLTQEMESMQKLDLTFKKLSKKLHLSGDYSVKNINFDCLRSIMDSYEEKCGRLSDYGLTYVKYFVEACEDFPAHVISSQVSC